MHGEQNIKIPPLGLREGQRHAVIWNVGAKILPRMPGVASYILAHYRCNSFLLNYPQARALCKCCSNCCRKPVMWRLGLEVKQLPLDHPLWATRRSLVQGNGAFWCISLAFCETLHYPQSSQDTDVHILENQTLCLKVQCCTELLIVRYVTIKNRSEHWMAVSLKSESEGFLSLPCAGVFLFGLVLSDTCIGRIFRSCYLYLLLLLFHWHYSPLWALACRTMSFHFFLSATNSVHLLTPSTWRSLYTSSFHLFLGLPFLLVPTSSWVKIFLGIPSSSIHARWPNQLIICPFIHFTKFSPLLISSSSRFVRLFRSTFSYLGPYILLNIFLSKICRACSSFFVNVHASAPYDTTDLISVLYSIILVALDKSRLLKRLIGAK